jgi:fatty-acyl-CoA synthase
MNTHDSASYMHRGGAQPLLGRTIPEHFGIVVNNHPNADAVVSVPQNRRLSYLELRAAVDELARGLVSSGFAPGDRIGIWSTNNVEWVLLQLATARIGVILVNINPALRTPELAYALERAEVHGLFAIPSFRTSRYVDMLVELLPELRRSVSTTLSNARFPNLRRVVLFDPADPQRTQRPYSGFQIWPEVFSEATKTSMQALDRITGALDFDDPINIQYTSGTTGFPKAVVLSHHNILNNAYFSATIMGLTERDRLCIPVPFYHCFGMVLANLACFSVGACAVIPCEHFDSLAVLESVENERCTAIHGVPTMFIAELDHPDFHRFDLSSLRTGIMAGAPCSPILMRRVIDEMQCPEILIGYGQTEAAPLTHLTSPEDTLERRVETVGTNLPHQEVKVIDVETGALLPRGRAGEICFRGYHVMKGYYGNAGATAEAIDKRGWLHSGDLGVMDSDGYLRITGRLKEMIIRGGENIFPREIEECLFGHPGVAEVAVFGVPDARFGEEVMAWVKPREDQRPSENELREYCKSRLAHFKIPKYIRFVDEFPTTVTGKMQKFRMREIAVAELRGQDGRKQ